MSSSIMSSFSLFHSIVEGGYQTLTESILNSVRNIQRKKKLSRSYGTAQSSTTLRASTLKTRPGKVSTVPPFFPPKSKPKISGKTLHWIIYILFHLLTYSSGGSLGWKVRGSLDPAFEKVAYELEPSTTANPKYAEVKTQFGYHIIMVEGRK